MVTDASAFHMMYLYNNQNSKFEVTRFTKLCFSLLINVERIYCNNENISKLFNQVITNLNYSQNNHTQHRINQAKLPISSFSPKSSCQSEMSFSLFDVHIYSQTLPLRYSINHARKLATRYSALKLCTFCLSPSPQHCKMQHSVLSTVQCFFERLKSYTHPLSLPLLPVKCECLCSDDLAVWLHSWDWEALEYSSMCLGTVQVAVVVVVVFGLLKFADVFVLLN